jgi:hypothetical protein
VKPVFHGGGAHRARVQCTAAQDTGTRDTGHWESETRREDSRDGQRFSNSTTLATCGRTIRPPTRDGALGAPGLGYVREWILRNARVLASVDLHPDTIQPLVSIQTSLLTRSSERDWLRHRSRRATNGRTTRSRGRAWELRPRPVVIAGWKQAPTSLRATALRFSGVVDSWAPPGTPLPPRARAPSSGRNWWLVASTMVHTSFRQRTVSAVLDRL